MRSGNNATCNYGGEGGATCLSTPLAALQNMFISLTSIKGYTPALKASLQSARLLLLFGVPVSTVLLADIEGGT